MSEIDEDQIDTEKIYKENIFTVSNEVIANERKLTREEITTSGIGKAESLTALQKAGINILDKVGSTALIIIVFIFIFSFVTFEKIVIPQPPNPPLNNSQIEIEQYQKAIEEYQKARQEYQLLIGIYNQNKKAQEERAINLFQTFIITGLLPTFTAILGYIFGSQFHNLDSD